MRIDIEEIWRAAAATVFEAGPLPEHTEDAQAHTANWYRLMRRYDPRLRVLTDTDIAEVLNHE